MSLGGFVKLVIEAKNLVLKKDLKEYIQRRVNFAFSHHNQNIENAKVSVLRVRNYSDCQKGNTQDAQCRVEILMDDNVEIVVSDIQSDIRHAIDRAIFRARFTLQQRIKRRYAQQNKAHYQRILAKAAGRKSPT